MKKLTISILAVFVLSLAAFADGEVGASEITNIVVKKVSNNLTLTIIAGGSTYSYGTTLDNVNEVTFLKSLQAQILFAKANDRVIHIYANGEILYGIEVK